MRWKQKIFYFFILSVAFFSFVVLFFDNLNEYDNLFYLPLAYIFSTVFLFNANRNIKFSSITVTIYIFLSFLRLVVLPLIGYTSGYYSSVPSTVDPRNIDFSILLLVIEQLISSVFIYILSHKFFYSRNSMKNSTLKLAGSKYGYFVFVIISFFVFIVFARGLNLFSFGFISLGEERIGDVNNFDLLMIRSIVGFGLVFLYISMVFIFKMKYTATYDKKYYLYSVILSVILILIIVGERRSSQIYTAFATGYLLFALYPKQRKISFRIIALTSIITLFFMTVYKSYNAFLYQSYFDVISSLEFDTFSYSSILDSNFFGVNVVARNITYSNQLNFTFQQLLYDLFRSVFGLSQILKSYSYTTTQIYNLELYNGLSTSGFLYSNIVYGFYYFGIGLSYIFSLIMLMFAFVLESLMRKTHYLEFKFLWSYLFARSIMTIFADPTSFINYSSRYYILFSLVVGFSLFFNIITYRDRKIRLVNKYSYENG
jgi:hypothetical protein